MPDKDLGLPRPHGAGQPGQLGHRHAICPAVEAVQRGAGGRHTDHGVDGRICGPVDPAGSAGRAGAHRRRAVPAAPARRDTDTGVRDARRQHPTGPCRRARGPAEPGAAGPLAEAAVADVSAIATFPALRVLSLNSHQWDELLRTGWTPGRLAAAELGGRASLAEAAAWLTAIRGAGHLTVRYRTVRGRR